ncbi:Transcription factor UPBEAT1 [Linum perenne]
MRPRRRIAMERRVKELRKLIPNVDRYESTGRVYRETADYITALEMRVRLMKIMVQVLTPSYS